MASLKEIRTRIKSVSSTKQITSAMKMVSAAKLRRAQDAILQLRPYAVKMQEILSNIAGSMEENGENEYTALRDPQNILVILVSSNRGLCGGFNANAIKHARNLVHEQFPAQLAKGGVRFVCIGKRGYDFLKSKKYPIEAFYPEMIEKPDFEAVSEFANSLMERFVKKEYDRIYLVYNQFKNAAVQILTTEQYLPVSMSENQEKPGRNVDYIFEPNKKEMVENLIPGTLRIQLFKALTDSYAAENGARMTAMHQATDNATDLMRELNITYNKARQAAITKELSEIVGGADAL